MLRFPLLGVLLVLLAAAPACKRPAGPDEAYRAFAAAVREGRADVAWSMLSKDSRAALDAEAKALSERSHGVVPARGAELVLGDAAFRSRPVKSAVVVRESKDAAVVAVEVEGEGQREVQLVREDGAWRVVLSTAAGAGRAGGQAP